jgi:hypothetical protein
MAGETKHGMECGEFETLLNDALDNDALESGGDSAGEGRLSPARRESFDAHRRVCGICGPLFADAQAGQRWLRTLALEPVEPPVHMVHNILAATSGVFSTRSEAVTSAGRATPFGERLRERWDSFSASFFRPLGAFVRQPRFVMSFGMIFFSFSLGLNAAGVKPSDVAKVNLRPSALRHAYVEAQIKVVKYYDNIRFVYEIESKLRELKRANTPAEPGPAAEPKQNHKNDTSGQPDQKQDRNYSQDYNQPVLAALREASPAVTVAVIANTNRRFV